MARIKVQNQESHDANQLLFGDEFNGVQCLLISEVKVLLEAQRHKKQTNGQEVLDILAKTLDYCEKFSKFTNKQTVKEIRNLFPDEDYYPFEIAQLANLCCLTAEETKLMIPSLERVDDDDLQSKLNELANLKAFQ